MAGHEVGVRVVEQAGEGVVAGDGALGLKVEDLVVEALDVAVELWGGVVVSFWTGLVFQVEVCGV